MNIKILLPVFFICLICFHGGLARENDASTPGKKLEAPALGITATSALLLWEDTFEPDYPASDSSELTREYRVYQNGTLVGSTTHKAFIVKNLTPGTNYTFSVMQSGNEAKEEWEGVRLTTKGLGKLVNVRDTGAKGDGTHDDTEAIQRSINTCLPHGTILVPAGNYLVGHLQLKSDITLHLEKGAVLFFKGLHPGSSLPKNKSLLEGPDGNIAYESTSLISGINVHNVVITGEGTIDANGETWWPHYKEITRPFTVEFINSSDLLVQGITIRDPPFWNNHLLYVDRAIYAGVKFLKVSRKDGVNGDGLDPDASRDILVAGCLFGNQDDAIAIKSGKYFEDGNKRRRSAERITIRDCVIDGNAAPGSNPLGIAIGSESSGGIKHVIIRDCKFINAASIANIKTNRERLYARVEDVQVENITYTNSRHIDRWWNRAPISVDLFYGAPESSDPSVAEPFSEQTPVFSNIHFKNIRIENPVGKGIYISGLAESPVHDIDFEKVYVRSRDGMLIRNVDVLSIKGITIIPIQ